jgi:heme/copper-type cytochrome/quinol oxidase subunit 2
MNQPLAETIFWIAALACAVAEIAILRSTISQRRVDNPNLVRAGSPITELIWAAVPAVALSFLLVATWHRIEARENHMRMHHSGHEMAASERAGGTRTRDTGSRTRTAD